MGNLVLVIVVIFILALPVRLAASWFNARRRSWGASILVLFVGAALVNVGFALGPTSWQESMPIVFLLIFCPFFVVSGFVLDIKLWQAAVLSLFITVIYSFAVSPLGRVGVGVHVGI